MKLLGALFVSPIVAVAALAACGSTQEAPPTQTDAAGDSGTSGGQDATAGKADAASDASGSGPQSGAAAQQAVKAFFAAAAEAHCASMVRCPEMGYTVPSLEACKDAVDFLGIDFLHDTENLVGAGSLAFDAAQAAACLQAWPKASCADLIRSRPAACDKVIVGTLATGAACDENRFCASGRCKSPASKQGCGTCADPSPVGAACDPLGNDCGDDLVCRDSTCVQPGTVAAGKACEVPNDCAAGLFCGADDTCQPFGDVGAACQNAHQCKPGLGCRFGTDKLGKCGAAGGAGEACVKIDFGVEKGYFGECKPGLVCSPGKTGAQCKPMRKYGEPCENIGECGAFVAQCLGGTCKPLPALGETCAPATVAPQCAKNLPCKADKCVDLAKAGDACTYDDECAAGLACTDKKCQATVALGASCDGILGPKCAAGITCSGDGVCVAPHICKL